MLGKGTSHPNLLIILFLIHPTLPSGDSWGDTRAFRPRFAPLPPCARVSVVKGRSVNPGQPAPHHDARPAEASHVAISISDGPGHLRGE